MHILDEGMPWYPGLAPVDYDSLDYQARVEWLRQQLIAAKPGIFVAEPSLVKNTFANTSAFEEELVFAIEGGATAQTNAVMTFYYPSVALIDLERKLNLPLSVGAQFTPPPPPPTPTTPTAYDANPVGEAVGGGYFRASGNPDPAFWSSSPVKVFTDPSGHRFYPGSWINVGRGFYQLS